MSLWGLLYGFAHPMTNGLIVKDDVEERAIYFQSAIIVDEPSLRNLFIKKLARLGVVLGGRTKLESALLGVWKKGGMAIDEIELASIAEDRESTDIKLPVEVTMFEYNSHRGALRQAF